LERFLPVGFLLKEVIADSQFVNRVKKKMTLPKRVKTVLRRERK